MGELKEVIRNNLGFILSTLCWFDILLAPRGSELNEFWNQLVFLKSGANFLARLEVNPLV